MDPLVDSTTGKVHGPLLQVLELQQIDNTYSNNDDKKSALEGMTQRAICNGNKYCPIHYEEKAAAYHIMFEDAEKEAEECITAAVEKDQQQYRERREERIAKRMVRIRSIYDSLEDSLDDCPLKDMALDCTWLEVCCCDKGIMHIRLLSYPSIHISHISSTINLLQNDERCVKFSCHIVEQKLSNIISAPASASERSINNVAGQIKTIFNTLHEKNFFSYSYIENSSNRFRKGIYAYCRNETTPLEIMKSSTAGDVHFMSALDENKPVRALVRALNRTPGRGSLPRIFALSVVKNRNAQAADAVDDGIDNRVADYRRLAETVWNKKAPNQYGSEIMSFNTIKETFNTSVDEFRRMKKNARDYLQHDDTVAFLLRDVSVAGRDNFSRQDALDQVFAPKTNTQWHAGNRSSPYDYIYNRNFTSLRSLHEQYFRRPGNYGVHRFVPPAPPVANNDDDNDGDDNANNDNDAAP